ncbi:YwqH-like family protein [Listeria booriae]|uniref:DUF5082 domain-containing protein n=1 Tax=Listeria booriae TaxID=1552123 RepID=A0A7X0XDH6_9LIST|nr:DUF5082 family protein [Listeria booriae]MBC1492203.1 DUF5082 domain-containing protein [Listeria booriae]MBC1503314.1 DUF5082 domain-containing protein [Listeria booriae]
MSADVSSLQADRNRKQAELCQVQSDQSNIQAKIERLKVAKKKVDEIQQSVDELQKAVNREREQDDTWRGKKYTTYSQFVSNGFHSDYKNYYQQIDQLYDHLCDEITRLENQASENDGLMGWLGSKLNSLGNEIDKLLHN